MSQTATVLPLSATQLRALEALATGASVTAASAIAGVSRSTLHRWLAEDSDFLAEYNRMRNELRAEAEARLLAASARAADTLIAAIGSGNVAAAIGLLKGLGLLSGSATRFEDDVEALRADAEERRELERFKRDFLSI